MLDLTALVLLLLAPAPEPPQPPQPPQPPKVAVIAVDDAAGLPASDVEQLTERAIDKLSAEGLDVVSGDDLRGRSCLDQPCRRRVLAPQGVHYWVTTGVTGAERVYDLHMRLWSADSDTALAESRERCVVCGHAELADRVAAQASELARSIRADASEPTVPALGESPAASGDGRTAEQGSAQSKRTGPGRPGSRVQAPFAWRRPAGIALAATGVATTALGAGLLAIDGEALPRRCGPTHPQNLDADGDCRYVHSTRGGGIIAIVVGAVLASAGVALSIVDAHARVRDRPPRAQVGLDIGLRRIGVRGRF